jgi:hypothetical protein
MQLCFILLLKYDLNIKSKLLVKNMDFIRLKKTKKSVRVPQYFVFTEIEIVSLVFCVVLDVIEYAAAILTMPLAGDTIDIVGILFCIFLFRWIGLLTFIELIPGADVFPVFIITWLVWYLLKKQKMGANKIQHLRIQVVFTFFNKI